jgi:hypothetical protein
MKDICNTCAHQEVNETQAWCNKRQLKNSDFRLCSHEELTMGDWYEPNAQEIKETLEFRTDQLHKANAEIRELKLLLNKES